MDVTRLLERARDGDRAAVDALIEAVYGELRRLASAHLRRERSGHTLSATALVHEAWLKLADQNQPWQGRAHFFGAASNAMRRILVDYARARTAGKRRGERVSLTAVEEELTAAPSFEELLAIDVLSPGCAPVWGINTAACAASLNGWPTCTRPRAVRSWPGRIGRSRRHHRPRDNRSWRFSPFFRHERVNGFITEEHHVS